MSIISNNLDEVKIKKIMENFNKDFETQLKANNTKFLVNLYENFINLLSTETTLDRESLKELDRMEHYIEDSFSADDKERIKKWSESYESLISIIAEQAFVYGYCTCRALEQASNMKGSADNE